jgi:hypothetical protein
MCEFTVPPRPLSETESAETPGGEILDRFNRNEFSPEEYKRIEEMTAVAKTIKFLK